MRMSTLNAAMIPGGKWYELAAGIDFPRDWSTRKVARALYSAAKRRGGSAAVRATPEGNIQVYATGCEYQAPAASS